MAQPTTILTFECLTVVPRMHPGRTTAVTAMGNNRGAQTTRWQNRTFMFKHNDVT